VALRRSSRPAVESLPVKVASLEAELARSREARDAEADDMAAMLVRIADADRAAADAAMRADQAETRVRALEALVVELKEWHPPAPVEDPRVPALCADLERERARAGGLEEVEASLRERNSELEARLAEVERELDVTGERLSNALGAVEMQTGRAVLAEQSAADGAEALRRALAELEADRARFVDLESKLARVRRERSDALEASRREHSEAVEKLGREHAQAMDGLRHDHIEALEALRREHESERTATESRHADALREREDRHAHALHALHEESAAAKRAAGRALEEERSAAARARQQIGLLETRLATMRDRIGEAAQQLEELERREEMAASLRARAIEHARSTLAAAEPPGTPKMPSPAQSSEAPSLDDIDLDIAD
jgi:hypothetical protein